MISTCGRRFMRRLLTDDYFHHLTSVSIRPVLFMYYPGQPDSPTEIHSGTQTNYMAHKPLIRTKYNRTKAKYGPGVVNGNEEVHGFPACRRAAEIAVKTKLGDWRPREAEKRSRRAKAERGALWCSWMTVNFGPGENINDKRSEIKIWECCGRCGGAVRRYRTHYLKLVGIPSPPSLPTVPPPLIPAGKSRRGCDVTGSITAARALRGAGSNRFVPKENNRQSALGRYKSAAHGWLRPSRKRVQYPAPHKSGMGTTVKCFDAHELGEYGIMIYRSVPHPAGKVVRWACGSVLEDARANASLLLAAFPAAGAAHRQGDGDTVEIDVDPHQALKDLKDPPKPEMRGLYREGSTNPTETYIFTEF
ncbi:hypothetical protein B0H19DRAFT_1235934 [Mycena capillaripes]|nr:hypothetical protein B0H19DRAFT_1235934 [Mycena capillaripes]